MAHTYEDKALAAQEYRAAAALKERIGNSLAYLLVILGTEVPECVREDYRKAYNECEAAWNRFQAVVHADEEVSA